ncbi:MAG: hypothetical protein IJM59_11665 [Proteobacteria bacterium]|nr:hypothetical protein [Pseudomonadota bacterium]
MMMAIRCLHPMIVLRIRNWILGDYGMSQVIHRFGKQLFPVGLLLTLAFSGCQQGGVHAAVERASSRIERAFLAGHKTVCEHPVELLTRFNPCECDETLMFEVYLYGQWQYIRMAGTEEELVWLHEQAKQHDAGQSFIVWYMLTNELYTTKQGQSCHVLLPIAGDQLREMME